VITRTCRLTVCGQPIVGSNLRLIDVRKKLVVTRSDLWPAGCWDRTGVDVIATGFSWVCTVLMFLVGGLFLTQPGQW